MLDMIRNCLFSRGNELNARCDESRGGELNARCDASSGGELNARCDASRGLCRRRLAYTLALACFVTTACRESFVNLYIRREAPPMLCSFLLHACTVEFQRFRS